MMANVIYNLTMSSSDGSLNRDIVTVTVVLTLNVYLAVTIIIIYLLFPSNIKTFKVKEKKLIPEDTVFGTWYYLSIIIFEGSTRYQMRPENLKKIYLAQKYCIWTGTSVGISRFFTSISVFRVLGSRFRFFSFFSQKHRKTRFSLKKS